MRAPISMAIVAPSDIIYAGLKRILARSRFRVAYRCQTIEEIRDAIPRDDPEVAIILVHATLVPDVDELARLIRPYTAAKLVIMANPHIYREIVQAGGFADGVVLDSTKAEVFVKTLELVALGERVLPTAALLDRTPVDHEMAPCAIPSTLQRLSERELDVLRLLCTGSPNKVIARQLDISEATVKLHVKTILRKTNAKNRTEAALLMRPLLEPHRVE